MPALRARSCCEWPSEVWVTVWTSPVLAASGGMFKRSLLCLQRVATRLTLKKPDPNVGDSDEYASNKVSNRLDELQLGARLLTAVLQSDSHGAAQGPQAVSLQITSGLLRLKLGYSAHSRAVQIQIGRCGSNPGGPAQDYLPGPGLPRAPAATLGPIRGSPPGPRCGRLCRRAAACGLAGIWQRPVY